MIAISIVSHGHGSMVSNLLAQLIEYPEVSKIFLTLNIHENLNISRHPKVYLINNLSPKGFSENHNDAFRRCEAKYFCPMNPDIVLPANPFPSLIESLVSKKADLIAPKILDTTAQIEDSIRYFPTPFSIFKKLFFKNLGAYNLELYTEIFSPEWVGGMFMLFKSSSYAKLNGFDENFFLYYEDVDICARTWRAGMKIIVNPSVHIIHDARRSSRKNFTYFALHFKSMSRYFFKYVGRIPKLPLQISDD